MKNNKGIASILIFLIVVGVLAIGGAYYFWSQKSQKQVACTQEEKTCPDGSTVVRVGPNCEFVACPEAKEENRNKISDEDAKKLFKATEIVSNNLPDSIEFWTEANCPHWDNEWIYQIPDYYSYLSDGSPEDCIKGEMGSHGGCPTCIMSKIKLLSWKTYKNEEYGFEFKYPPTNNSVYDPDIKVYNCDGVSLMNDCSISDKNRKGTYNKEIVNINNTSYCLTINGDSAAGSSWHIYNYITNKNNSCLSLTFTIKSGGCGGVGGGSGLDYEKCIKSYKENESETIYKITSSFKILQ